MFNKILTKNIIAIAFMLLLVPVFLICQNANGAYYRQLNKTSYSYQVFSFFEKDGVKYMFDMVIYPDADLRTHMYYGKITNNTPNSVSILVSKESKMENEHKGTYSPFDSDGIWDVRKPYQKDYKIEFRNDKLYYNGVEYSSYNDDMQKAFDKKDVNTLFKLYQFHIYLIQSFVEGFGGMGMLNYHKTREGFISGTVEYLFEMRGEGIGVFASNTGLNSIFKNFSVFYSITLVGNIYGGKSKLEDSLTVNIGNGKSFKIDFNNVLVKKGIAFDGYYGLTLSNSANVIKVLYTQAAP